MLIYTKKFRKSARTFRQKFPFFSFDRQKTAPKSAVKNWGVLLVDSLNFPLDNSAVVFSHFGNNKTKAITTNKKRLANLPAQSPNFYPQLFHHRKPQHHRPKHCHIFPN
ncbi:hypothetical protein BKK52_07595 [Rodentibacter trehalosifermentans]|uniref:Uncharacterized protein n=1 Tax=Rodentibacter trehalosifermentans TaxID=1908263 RepID=A0A1V3IZZ9_9PAST|nr:hypothetical protein BKK52_07595 [Rodentibacter trehalosifermentans]